MNNARMIGVGAFVVALLFASQLAAQNKGPAAPQPQASPNKPTQVTGSGTPGTVPVWNGTTSLGDSHIQSGTQVTVNVPLQVSGTVFGSGVKYGISGTATGPLDPSDFCCVSGVIGVGSDPTHYATGVAGYVNQEQAAGTLGLNDAGGIGVLALSRGGNHLGAALQAETDGGSAGIFIAQAGGSLLHGFSTDGTGPSGWQEKFLVDVAGNLWTYGNASKPGGGSWSVLSDARTKKSVEPIRGALGQLLQLHGVTFEYTNPSAFHELTGVHIGVMAQDVEQVFPSWVDTGTDGYKRVTFRGFEAVTVEALRELNSQMSANASETAARIDRLERENKELKQSMESLLELLKKK
jgi:hypothetical protein